MNDRASLTTIEPSQRFLGAVLLLMFAMNMIGRGVTETFAVFLLPVEKAFDASRSDMLLTYSIYNLVYGLSAPFTGQLVDRAGPRVAYGFGLCMLGGGYVLAGTATSLPLYYLAVGVLGGVGAASLGMVVASSIMSRWFVNRLGAIMSLPYAALGAGMLFIPPATQLLIDRLSWQQAYQVLGYGVLAVLPLLIFLPLRRIGEGSATWQASRASAVNGGLKMGWTLRDAMSTRAFWGLFGAYFATSVASYAVAPQMVAYLVEQGYDRLLAASAFGMTGACSVIGIISMGAISDRIGRRRAALISYVMSIAGVMALILVAQLSAFWPVYLFILLFGLMQGVRGPIILALVATVFRGASVGSIFGALTLAPGLGAAVGSWGSGYLHDVTDGYFASFALGILGSCVGMFLFWSLPSLAENHVATRRDGAAVNSET
ncbi:MAG: MFS transporter [Hyphomicrobiaceae bacterium]